MRLWIDGGSLHSVPRCLAQRGEPDDAFDQLHLAIQLVFADTLIVGSYGGGAYATQTDSARDALVDLGFERACVESADASRDVLERVYVEAAESLAPRLGDTSSATRSAKAGLLGPFRQTPIPSYTLPPSVRKLEDEFDRVIRQDLLPSDRDALFEKVRSEENNGLIVMLTKSDDYWKVVRALVGDGQAWTQNDTKALAAASRVFIHDEHAQVTAATYAPNWRRGRALRTSHFSQQIIDELQGLGTGPAPFQVGEIGLPPLAAALAQRASGDPRRLLAQALEMRQAAAPLRRHLARLVRATEDGDDEMIRLAGEELKYLTIELQTAVTVHEVEGVNALDMFALNAFVAVMVGTLSHPMYGLMAAGVMGALTAKKKAIERLLRRRRQRIAVLSELAGELGPARIQPQALAQLQHGISSKRDAAPAS